MDGKLHKWAFPRAYKLGQVKARKVDASEPDFISLDALDHVLASQLGHWRSSNLIIPILNPFTYAIDQSLEDQIRPNQKINVRFSHSIGVKIPPHTQPGWQEALLIYRKPVVLRLPQQLPVLGVGERGDGAVPEPVEHVPEQLPVAVHEHGPILLQRRGQPRRLGESNHNRQRGASGVRWWGGRGRRRRRARRRGATRDPAAWACPPSSRTCCPLHRRRARVRGWDQFLDRIEQKRICYGWWKRRQTDVEEDRRLHGGERRGLRISPRFALAVSMARAGAGPASRRGGGGGGSREVRRVEEERSRRPSRGQSTVRAAVAATAAYDFLGFFSNGLNFELWNDKVF